MDEQSVCYSPNPVQQIPYNPEFSVDNPCNPTLRLLALGWEVLTTTAITVLASNALETDQEGDAIQKEFWATPRR